MALAYDHCSMSKYDQDSSRSGSSCPGGQERRGQLFSSACAVSKLLTQGTRNSVELDITLHFTQEIWAQIWGLSSARNSSRWMGL